MAVLSNKILLYVGELCSNTLDTIFMVLDRVLIKNNEEYNTYIMIKGRFSEFRENRNMGCLTFNEVTTQGQQIRLSIMDYLQSLENRHFIREFVKQPDNVFDLRTIQSSKSNERPNFQIQKNGSLLYCIPQLMQINRSYRCIVRIAYYREILLKNLENSDSNIKENIRIGDEMEVEIVDVNSGYIKHFEIVMLNKSNRQLLDADDYTEWLFDIKPLILGASILRLHIVAIEFTNGKEAKKDIVLEEEVIVMTTEVSGDTTSFKKYQRIYEINESRVRLKKKVVKHDLEDIIVLVIRKVAYVLFSPIALVYYLFTRGAGGGGGAAGRTGSSMANGNDDDDNDDD